MRAAAQLRASSAARTPRGALGGRRLPGTALLALLALGGCGNDFEPISHLEGLRLLGVRADPPEVGPGQTSRLEALALDTLGQPVRIAWAICHLIPVPASGDPVNPDCLREDLPQLEPLGEGATIDVSMPELGPLELGLPDYTVGFYLPVRVRITAGERRVDGFYRLRYLVGGAPNQNPVLAGISRVTVDEQSGEVVEAVPLEEDQPTVVPPGGELTLRADFAPDSAETYQVIDGVGSGLTEGAGAGSFDPGELSFRPATELLRASWFTAAGSLSESVTGKDQPLTIFRADDHLPPAEELPPEGLPIDLYLVGRDERGGAVFARRTILVR